MSKKVSDEFTVPLCRIHHRQLHHAGDEASWWNDMNVDPLPIAQELWQQSRGRNESEGGGAASTDDRSFASAITRSAASLSTARHQRESNVMASRRQIAANRRNARKSTGPRTSAGKLRSRSNALKHGLTAETVITVFENPKDYASIRTIDGARLCATIRNRTSTRRAPILVAVATAKSDCH